MRDRGDESSLVVATGGAIAVIVVAALVVPLRDWLGNTNVALVLVGLVVVSAALAGRLAGVLTALAAAISFNFFHTQPYSTLRIDDREDIVTVVLVFVVGLAVGEIALLRRQERAVSRVRAAGARDLEGAVGLLAAGAPIEEVWVAVRQALVSELGLAGATYRPGAPAGDAPRIDRVGRLRPLPSRFAHGGFELQPGTCLPVAAGDRLLGCIELAPMPGRGVAPEQRRLAVALADVLAVALSRSSSIPTLR